MKLYCPNCFNNSLHIAHKGIVHIIINGKKMDTGRFLFNLENNQKRNIDEFNTALRQKIEEFFAWYSNFKNKDPITKVQLVSFDVFCENKCRLPLGQNHSILDIFVPRTEITEILKELGKKYSLRIKL